jgi:multisubunit Na+/H+ antiporter MnhB subunit
MDLWPFAVTVWMSVTCLGLSGILWLALGIVAFTDGQSRKSAHRWWEPKWEYVVSALLLITGLIFLAGAAQIWYDPTGLVDGFGVVSGILLAVTSYGLFRWLTRRF